MTISARIAGLCLCLAAAAAFGEADRKGDSADPQRDIIELNATAQTDGLVVQVESAADWNFNAIQILLGNGDKGFQLNEAAFDLMIENATLYRYSGTGTDWTWMRLGEIKRDVAGHSLKVVLPSEYLTGAKINVVARSLSDDWQTAFDTAPDTSALSVALDKGGSAPADADPTAGNVADGALDLTRFTVSQEGSELVIRAELQQPGDFGTLLIFFDSDRNASTGFLPPADPNYGFDLLINGEQLLKHTGGSRDAWTWSAIASVDRAVKDNELVIRLDAGAFGSTDLDVTGWMMSRDWQTRVDRSPGIGLMHVTIDPSKLAAPKPPAELSAPKANRHLSARQRVADARSYYCYYGSGNVAELSQYDLVVLHYPEMKSADVKTLSGLGVVTVGYITVGESEPPTPMKGDGTGPGGYASWYFDKDNDNQPDMNPIWKSYYANANDPGWRANRVAEAKMLVNEYGFDGIFLDTIDTAMSNPESAPGMVQLVKDLREALPDAPIVLNQGFPLLPQLAPISDALMLESFTATYDFDSRTYMMNYPQSIDHHLMRVQKEILPVLKEHPLKVLVLDYAPQKEKERIQEAANRAATFGFLFAAAPISLDAVYPNDIVGKPDPKWFNRMSTPESLAYTLEKPANGFPAGTRLMPANAFAGYKVDAIVDGVKDRSGMHWSKAAWASAEDGEEAWLQIDLPTERSNGTLRVDWEPSHPSQAFTVQAQDAGGNWRDVSAVKGNKETSVQIRLAGSYRSLRLIQNAGDGSKDRPDLMWIAQVHLD